MKRLTALVVLTCCLIAADCHARGGFSSGGRGGFSSGRSYGGYSRSYSSPSRITTTRTTTINRSYGGGYYGGYYGHPMMYPGFGMGYGYSNGMMTGLIIGSLMHPQGTTVYSGGGYGGQALLYPDGRVVDQNGYQVGTYINGQFTSQAGGMVAQPAPIQQGQPVNIGYSDAEIAGGIIITLLVVMIIFALVI